MSDQGLTSKPWAFREMSDRPRRQSLLALRPSHPPPRTGVLPPMQALSHSLLLLWAWVHEPSTEHSSRVPWGWGRNDLREVAAL